MNSFVATAAPAVAATPIEGTLTNDGFFPDIDLSALRDAMRLDGTVTAERLRHAARDALLTVNDELAAWRARQRAAGAATLADVPAPRIDGESAHVARYRRAVYHLTHADVTEKYAATTRRRAAARSRPIWPRRSTTHAAPRDGRSATSSAWRARRWN